ncbi:hypothetical protein FRZ67_09960 [Panacibacter ginsenosidivorans]|uniref:Uncharacterized protein n=1 Tax=Panacibacter ginsenosidivorans TaxID=1813871 RepID=A0A5B8VBC4_9BACT|nr:hypothetical protein [Panacibacter ginsenosidivorans]QEC67598.1 hypothetical protein FRZ67_09960 [Panacibacter ginsenosidivorans]
MNKTSTLISRKFTFYIIAGKVIFTLLFLFCFLLSFSFQPAKAGELDSANNKKPVIVNDLEQCNIPQSMVMRIKHLSPVQIKDLNEEYQHTDLTEEGEEIVTIVKLRFIDNHITGYIKEVLMSNSEKPKSLSYIDIPIEWMCIPPKQDHPFHFSSDISELDSIKEENGCLDWVQRDNEVMIKFAEGKKAKKKSKFFN